MRDADGDLVALEVDRDPRRSRFVVAPSMRPGGPMYGGAGIAAAVIVMELVTERPVMWVTTQFVQAPTTGDVVECHTEVLADGGRTAQLRVTSTVDGELAFLSLGSVGRPRADGLHGQFAKMPSVGPPNAAAQGSWGPPRPEGMPGPVSYAEAEMIGEEGFGHLALWARRRGGGPFSAAALAYAADMAPIAVARAAGRLGAGSSLDNSLRFAAVGEHFANGGYGHCSLRAWAEDGTLLATGGQTTNMRYLFDEDNMPEEVRQALARRAPG
jgi:acyl-CoA thioesterase